MPTITYRSILCIVIALVAVDDDSPIEILWQRGGRPKYAERHRPIPAGVLRAMPPIEGAPAFDNVDEFKAWVEATYNP